MVSIVSGGCNQSSSALFYVVVESLYRWLTLFSMLVNLLPPSLTDIFSAYGISYAKYGHYFSCSLVHFKDFFWSTSRMVTSILRGETAKVFIPLRFVSSDFLFLLRYFKKIFFCFTCFMVSDSNMTKYF